MPERARAVSVALFITLLDRDQISETVETRGRDASAKNVERESRHCCWTLGAPPKIKILLPPKAYAESRHRTMGRAFAAGSIRDHSSSVLPMRRRCSSLSARGRGPSSTAPLSFSKSLHPRDAHHAHRVPRPHTWHVLRIAVA